MEPAQQVQRAEWHDGGVLDVWIRDNGEWLGRVRDRDGRITWVPGPATHRPDPMSDRGPVIRLQGCPSDGQAFYEEDFREQIIAAHRMGRTTPHGPGWALGYESL